MEINFTGYNPNKIVSLLSRKIDINSRTIIARFLDEQDVVCSVKITYNGMVYRYKRKIWRKNYYLYKNFHEYTPREKRIICDILKIFFDNPGEQVYKKTVHKRLENTCSYKTVANLIDNMFYNGMLRYKYIYVPKRKHENREFEEENITFQRVMVGYLNICI